MRRTLPVLMITATLLFAACSSDGGSDSDSSTPGSVPTSEATDGSTPADGSTPTPPTNPDKPEVEPPDEIPTELQVTVIEEGSGPEAKAGDTVIVDYVGVRSSDGVEFDNSYDRFEPIPVVLGQGQVIAGWDEGLVGVQAGSTVRLDIPADKAYGENGSGELIPPNEALTFLIEVRAVIPPPDPANAPTEAGVPASEGATDTIVVDLKEGDGEELQPGQTGIINYVLFRGDNLVQLESSWEADPVQVGTAAVGGFPGFVKGLPGMKVGGRRAIIVPPDDAFGPEGNPQLGLPAGADMIIVVDLLGVYGTPEG
jgi:FKBP-type peptidyl-prolyl cis-trans isomerase